jgi:hypothetical protein
MSTRWRGYNVGDVNLRTLDLAGQYALELKSLHRNCIESPNFNMHTNFGELLPSLAIPKRSKSSRPMPISPSSQVAEAQSRIRANTHPKQQQQQPGTHQHQDSRLPLTTNGNVSQPYPIDASISNYAGSPPNVPASPFTKSPYSTHQQHQFERQDDHPHASQQQPAQSPNSCRQNSPMATKVNNTGHRSNGVTDIQSIYGSEHNSVEDELTAMSHVLLGQQFLEMDRVITFHETNFALDYGAWEGFS